MATAASKTTNQRSASNSPLAWGSFLSGALGEGNIAKSLLGEGVKLGVSSRGVGSVAMNNEGVNVVGEDFMLATAADIVADPSAPDAFVDGIMEGKNWVWDGGVLREQQAAKTYKQINTLASSRQLQENKIKLFSDFLKNL